MESVYLVEITITTADDAEWERAASDIKALGERTSARFREVEGGSWVIELPDFGSGSEAVSTVEGWLDEIGESRTEGLLRVGLAGGST